MVKSVFRYSLNMSYTPYPFTFIYFQQVLASLYHLYFREIWEVEAVFPELFPKVSSAKHKSELHCLLQYY